ncbi:Hypothetical predicted protein [Olea europaea subsp. europaea]|uniref:RNA polymerase II subunit B1 CTD phosphatase RPAP2 homolog n=1 Tax=Olea europaea subsp. europaea TaxID=158383 RepID=A0A8S0RMP0_OLEEU|nr:Hypothetical predicted protein [Olea europaea subsp. europaea]
MDEVLTVKDAVHKLQLSLLESIKDENQLFAAGSLMSQSDYQDVVTEHTIANTHGYPLCENSLPFERPRKGHYRISLKEHKMNGFGPSNAIEGYVPQRDRDLRPRQVKNPRKVFLVHQILAIDSCNQCMRVAESEPKREARRSK